MELFEEFQEAAREEKKKSTSEETKVAALMAELEETKNKMADLEESILDLSKTKVTSSSATAVEQDPLVELKQTLLDALNTMQVDLVETEEEEYTSGLASKVRGSFVLKKKEFSPKEWPRGGGGIDSSSEGSESERALALVEPKEGGDVAVAQLELELEKLRVQALRVEVLEEKINAIEISARAREKELLLLLEEKDKSLTSLEQIVRDQESFVAEIRQAEILQASSDVQSGLEVELESRLMSAQATIAEVEAEKNKLQSQVEELQASLADGSMAKGQEGEKDPLLPEPASQVEEDKEEKSAEEAERFADQEKLIRSLQSQLKEKETQEQQNVLTNNLEASQEDKLNQQVARIRQLEIEMSQMATVQESDQIVRELTEAKMTIHQLKQELELVRLSALAPGSEKAAGELSNGKEGPIENVSFLPVEEKPKKASKSLSNGHDNLKNGVFKRNPPGSFVLKKKYFTPKQLQSISRGSFKLKKKEFTRKPWPRTAASAQGKAGKQRGGTFNLKKKEFSRKTWPRTQSSSFVRGAPGSFVLKKKQFSPKQIPRAGPKAIKSEGSVFFSESSFKSQA